VIKEAITTGALQLHNVGRTLPSIHGNCNFLWFKITSS